MYGKAFFSDVELAKRLKTPLLSGVVVLHAIYLVLRTIEFNHPPITTIFEILTLLAFSIALVYLGIELRSKAKETGYFILNIAFFFQIGSTIFIQDLTEVPDVLRSNLLGLHVSSALFGYAAITISAVYGFLYLMLYHEIKMNQFGVIYKKLPSLETLERMSYSAFKIAFVFLGLSMLVGFIWLPQANVEFSYTDPKLVGTLAVWALYGLGIIAKHSGGWQGRRVMILAICGFVFSIFSLTVVNVFFSSFHGFY
ncbi:MAG TPA: cytochrome c biogenesis protein CcsA [Bacteroidota bacterium]|nr:cytochrome c biogenesis protein CcsA [Bacteroidota bacterium]